MLFFYVTKYRSFIAFSLVPHRRVFTTQRLCFYSCFLAYLNILFGIVSNVQKCYKYMTKNFFPLNVCEVASLTPCHPQVL